ncbi:hypothetical protein AB0950_25170 [Streptomyces sp. NPDC007189]|uniref:hypothetical protein n=1 Tax=unclassified Streptomyces TaxID=2593676 RepID=UPI0033CDF967
MSDAKKDGQAVQPDNVHITDAKDSGTGTATTDNVHITDAKDSSTGTVTTDNVHITSEPS